MQANEIVLKRLLRSYQRRTTDEKSANIIKILNNNAADKELLKDLISENKQAIILVGMYTNIFSNTMDAFASMISNNLNIVMRFLALITIALAVPTIVMSYYGMNVKLPFQYEPLAHFGILLLSIILMVSITFLINKKRF